VWVTAGNRNGDIRILVMRPAAKNLGTMKAPRGHFWPMALKSPPDGPAGRLIAGRQMAFACRAPLRLETKKEILGFVSDNGRR